MSNQNTSTAEAQGAPAVLTLDQVEKYLVKDIAVAISCLSAIQSDPDLLRSMAAFMLGRLENSKMQPKEEALN